MNIGQRVREIRTKKKLTRKEFSVPIEINSQHLYKIEAGIRNASIPLLKKISIAYSVPMSYFFNENEDEAGKPE